MLDMVGATVFVWEGMGALVVPLYCSTVPNMTPHFNTVRASA